MKTVLESVSCGSKNRVDDYIPWTCEFADQALIGAQIGYYAATRNTFQDVLGVPRN